MSFEYEFVSFSVNFWNFCPLDFVVIQFVALNETDLDKPGNVLCHSDVALIYRPAFIILQQKYSLVRTVPFFRHVFCLSVSSLFFFRESVDVCKFVTGI